MLRLITVYRHYLKWVHGLLARRLSSPNVVLGLIIAFNSLRLRIGFRLRLKSGENNVLALIRPNTIFDLKSNPYWFKYSIYDGVIHGVLVIHFGVSVFCCFVV